MIKVRMFLYFSLVSMVFLALTFVLYTTFSVFNFAGKSTRESADSAIVLGGVVFQDQPSQAFEQRIRHAISLHQEKKVTHLIFTGKPGDDNNLDASQVAKMFAVTEGLPGDVIVTHSASDLSAQLKGAQALMTQHGWQSALVVGEALQMKRIIAMAEDMGMRVYSAPVLDNRAAPLMAQSKILAKETIALIRYKLQQWERAGYFTSFGFLEPQPKTQEATVGTSRNK